MISVQNLRKEYNGKEVLKGVSFEIKEGEFFGLLGPNGAGKTTTISILSTILSPDSGSVTIAGLDVRKQAQKCKSLIGIVPQEIALYKEMSAFDNLMFWGSLYNLNRNTLKTKIFETLHLFGLADRMHDNIKEYSGGMMRRVNIASALLHNPKVLIMDEPTVGVDPQSRNLIFEVVEKLHHEGLTILYTTHYMEEAERLCERLAIIDNGEIITQGVKEELKKSVPMNELIKISINNLNNEVFEKLASYWPHLKQEEETLLFSVNDSQKELAKVISKCNELNLEVKQIDIQKINLEMVFLHLTGKQLRD